MGGGGDGWGRRRGGGRRKELGLRRSTLSGSGATSPSPSPLSLSLAEVASKLRCGGFIRTKLQRDLPNRRRVECLLVAFCGARGFRQLKHGLTWMGLHVFLRYRPVKVTTQAAAERAYHVCTLHGRRGIIAANNLLLRYKQFIASS